MRKTIGRRPVLQGIAAAASLDRRAARLARRDAKLAIAKSIPDLSPIRRSTSASPSISPKRGLELEVGRFNGSARMNQAMSAARSISPSARASTMSDIGKGEPALCIAQTLGPPADIAIVVPYDSPIKRRPISSGKGVGVASTGSVTEWMVFELARQKGWPISDMKTVGLGGTDAAVAAIRAKQVDALVVRYRHRLFPRAAKGGALADPVLGLRERLRHAREFRHEQVWTRSRKR